MNMPLPMCGHLWTTDKPHMCVLENHTDDPWVHFCYCGATAAAQSDLTGLAEYDQARTVTPRKVSDG